MTLELLDQRLDTLGYGVLQSLKGASPIFEPAVIAGGYLRDIVYNKQFKDIDIFLPKMPLDSFYVACKRLPDDYRIIKSQLEFFGQSAKYSMKFTVVDLLYLESISLQIILTNFHRVNFNETLLNSFDYGICQVVSEGQEIFGTEGFVKDKKNGTATLLNLQDVSHLPRHMKRFYYLQEKLSPLLGFRCNDLELTEPKKAKRSKLTDYITEVYAETEANAITLPTTATEDYLNMTLDDVMGPNDALDWVLLDEMFDTNVPSVVDHAHELIDQFTEEQGNNGED